MSGKHPFRLLGAGFLAGIGSNLPQFMFNRIFITKMWALGTAGIAMPVTHHTPLIPFLMNMLGGIIAVWIYVLLRERYGAGNMTAVRAGAGFWLLCWLFPVTFWATSGPVPQVPVWLIGAHLLTYFFIAVLETMAGAWVYSQRLDRLFQTTVRWS